MVEGNASMYLGSPRMAEMVIGENRRKETLFFNGYADEVADLYGELNVLELYR